MKKRTSMKRKKKTRRVKKAKKRKMIPISTLPKLNLANNRNASNNKSINDFIEHFDTKLYWIINRTSSKPQKFLVKRKYFKNFVK